MEDAGLFNSHEEATQELTPLTANLFEGKRTFVVAGETLVGLAIWLAPAPPSAAEKAAAAQPAGFAEAKAVIDQRCALCHNAQVQSKNVALHTPELIAQHAQAIYQQTVVLKLMPMNNATQITEAERALIKRWYESGAPVQ